MKLRVYWIGQTIAFLLFGGIILWSIIFRFLNEMWYPKNMALIICELIVLLFFWTKSFLNFSRREILLTENIANEMNEEVVGVLDKKEEEEEK